MPGDEGSLFTSGLSVNEFALEFLALGTAIVRTGEVSQIEPPVPVLDLNDR